MSREQGTQTNKQVDAKLNGDPHRLLSGALP